MISPPPPRPQPKVLVRLPKVDEIAIARCCRLKPALSIWSKLEPAIARYSLLKQNHMMRTKTTGWALRNNGNYGAHVLRPNMDVWDREKFLIFIGVSVDVYKYAIIFLSSEFASSQYHILNKSRRFFKKNSKFYKTENVGSGQSRDKSGLTALCCPSEQMIRSCTRWSGFRNVKIRWGV